MAIRLSALLLLLFCFPGKVLGQRAQISLDGTWQFQTDPGRIGLQEGWHTDARPLTRRIEVPGSWQAQGIGEPRDYLRHDYTGQAWYKREVEIPSEWKGKQAWLKITGASRSVEVFINGKGVGSHDGFSAPFQFDITPAIHAGQENIIAVAVDNSGGSDSRLPLKEMDSTRPGGAFNFLGNWGGLYGHVSLEATESVWIDEVYIRTRLNPRHVILDITIASKHAIPARPLELSLTIRPIRGEGRSYTSRTTVSPPYVSSHAQTITLPMSEAELWSPENPFRYVAEIDLVEGEQVLDTLSQPFGVREITARNGKFYLNGQPYYLRGTGDLSVEVITGTPPVSLEENRRRVKTLREFGFNFVRLHSRIPPREFFQAADEMGLLISAELPVFYSLWLLPHLDYVLNELPEVYRAFRNHPSWISSALGNELHPLPGKEKEFQQAFDRFYEAAKRLHPDHLVMATDGFAFRPADYFSTLSGYSLDPEVPSIAHEWGGWYCSLPDIALAPRFSGVVDPYWMREMEEWLRENRLLDIYPEILKNSQRLQFLAHRFRVEQVRNNPDMQGYQIPSGVTDFPSGSREGELWAEGVLDFFWEPKYGSARDWSRINAATLLLTDADISERTWWQGTTAKLRVKASHYGPRALEEAELRYRLEYEGKVLLEHVVPNLRVQNGELASLADLAIEVPELDKAAALTLRLELYDGERIAENDWTFWAYPRVRLANSAIPVISRLSDTHMAKFYPFIHSRGTAKPGDLVILDILDHQSFQEIRNGASALMLAQPNRTGGQHLYDFFPTFETVHGSAPSGTRVEAHPLFRNFPHDGFCDAQFYNLMEGAMGLEGGGPRLMMDAYTPLVWSLSSIGTRRPAKQGIRPGLRKLGFIYEFRVGRGKVLLTSLNIQKFLDEGYPSSLYFFDQLIRYLTGSEFHPKEEMPDEEFTQFLHGKRP